MLREGFIMARKFDPAEIPLTPGLQFEAELWRLGVLRVAGLDEAGRGAWAGPVSAGAVILPADERVLARLEGVRDSKQMTPKARAEWARMIPEVALAWGVGLASQQEIDSLGIVPATRLAMLRALEACAARPQHLLIDALRLPGLDTPQTALIKGDARCMSIAAASVLAKTARDGLMVELDGEYPGYGFARHKGYGTSQHQEALRQLGACVLHRQSFAPLRQMSPPGEDRS